MPDVVNFQTTLPQVSGRFRSLARLCFLLFAASVWTNPILAQGAKADGSNPLAEWLLPDGSFQLKKGFTGSLEAQGWRLLSVEDGKPRLVKSEKGGPVLFGTGVGAWDERFSLPGLDGIVYAIAILGTNTYVGGQFTTAGGISAINLAKWDGFGWSQVGGGVDGPVRALAVDGTKLWVGGSFTRVGTRNAQNVAIWTETGKAWSSPTPSVDIDGTVRAIVIVNAKPYIGGEFDNGIVTIITDDEGNDSWEPPEDGVDGYVFALTANGTEVLVGGDFDNAGGMGVNNIARWNGTAWSAFGSGVDDAVNAIAVRATNAIYAGGIFSHAGGELADRFARWNGTNWETVVAFNGPITLRSVDVMAVRGGDVLVGGDFDAPSGGIGNHVIKFDGTNWATLAAGVNGNVHALATNATGLFVGGDFQQAGGLVARGFAFWSEAGDLQKVGTGLNGYVNTLFVASDNEVYAGGEFTRAGNTNVSRIARWDGTNWFPLAEGIGGTVNAITSNGSDLFVGGNFTNAGTAAATNIARWNGLAWSALGPGLNGPVQSLAVTGGSLIAGGSFTASGNLPCLRVARWDGSNWSPLGAGLNDTVQSVAVRWTEIHVGGSFTASGTNPVHRVARWDGRKWVGLGEGVDGPVSALSLTPSGDLIVGGRFSAAGSIRGANNIARWDGTNWGLLGIGLNGAIRTLHVVDGEVFAGGSFNNAGGLPVRNVARWIEANQSWALLLNLTNNGVDGNVFAVASTRSHMYLGGIFNAPGGVTNLTRIQRSGWSTFGHGVGDASEAIAIDDVNIYAGGSFAFAGGVVANNVARWNGNNWSALGSGVNGRVHALAVDANGVLYVGGAFTNAGGAVAYHIARWDGFRWGALGIGLDGAVLALATQGTNLYAAGEFTRAGGFGANRVARWDGSRWTAVGSGCNNRVQALTVDATGTLYAGGEFSQAGGVPANRVAAWNGTNWTALGASTNNGANDAVLTLVSTADGLFAGGRFTSAGGRSNIIGVAYWDGSSWLSLGQGLQATSGGPVIRSLATTPGGGLFAAGEFHRAGSATTSFIARWDRSSWSSVGNGLDDTASALAVRGRELFVGGEFILAGGKISYHFARWFYAAEPPGLYFTSPAVGEVFTAPATIPLAVEAFDLDGTIRKVDFLSGTNVLASITNQPYSFTWTNVVAGIYSLSAKATDNDGLVTATSALLAVVTTNRAPYIALLTPTNGTAFTLPGDLNLVADARDQDGFIRQVEFLNGTNVIGTLTSPPYSLVWTNPPTGTNMVRARAIDNGGASTTSTTAAVVVLLPTPPSLAPVVLPGNGLELTITAPDGRRIVIESSFNLLEWVPVSTNVVSGGFIQFIDLDTTAYPMRFYRALDQPE